MLTEYAAQRMFWLRPGTKNPSSMPLFTLYDTRISLFPRGTCIMNLQNVKVLRSWHRLLLVDIS